MRTKQTHFAAIAALTSSALAITCDKDSLQSAFPSIATVDFATWMPANSTFTVPKTDIAYPVSPTQLRAACAVQVSVKNGTSNYGFGVFLPDDWNGRFLEVLSDPIIVKRRLTGNSAVGNGGFAGGINWLDMVSCLEYAGIRKD